MLRNLTIAFICIVLSACKNDKHSEQKVVSAVQAAKVSFGETDSLELYIFPNPSDQKTFTRYASADPALIRSLSANLAERNDSMAACVHYKKIYLFTRGEVFKTLYISDTCGYIAFADNSRQAFKKLQPATRDQLDNLVRSSTSP